jgi:hypothetical protein
MVESLEAQLSPPITVLRRRRRAAAVLDAAAVLAMRLLAHGITCSGTARARGASRKPKVAWLGVT